MDRTTRRLIAEAALVIVDFDGTLASLTVAWPALKHRLAEQVRAAGQVWDAERGLDQNLRRLRALGEKALFAQCCQTIAQAEYRGFDTAGVHHALVAALEARGGRPFGICSANTREALCRIIDSPCFARLHPVIIGKEDVMQGKPDPEGLLKLCTHLQVSPTEALFLGDTATDEVAAVAAGMPFRWAVCPTLTPTPS